jgi:hypothetical protein
MLNLPQRIAELIYYGLPDEPLWLAQYTLSLHMAKLAFNIIIN